LKLLQSDDPDPSTPSGTESTHSFFSGELIAVRIRECADAALEAITARHPSKNSKFGSPLGE
jgi:hypothetical protein